MAAIRRVQQGIRALLAFAYTVDDDLAARYLNDSQMRLFRQMARSEQLHSLNVLRTLLAQVEDPPHDLIVAALLHDVGKMRRALWVWEKTVIVLVERFLPALSDQLKAEETLAFGRAPFVVRRWHPEWGADSLAQIHSPERVIWLVRHHQDQAIEWRDHPNYDLLLQLQRADDAN